MNTTVKIFIGIALGMAITMTLFTAKGICAPVPAKIQIHIPGRYAMATISDQKEGNVTEAAFCPGLEAKRVDMGVDMLQTLFYSGESKSFGGGFIGLSEATKEECFVSVPDPGTSGHKFLEHLAGYQITPKEVYTAFEENEVIATLDFSDKPLLMWVNINEIGLDMMKRPYLAVHIKNMGLHNIMITLQSDDPFIRGIKKGQRVMIRAAIEGMTIQTLRMKGYIIFDGKRVLIDGKAVEDPLVEKIR